MYIQDIYKLFQQNSKGDSTNQNEQLLKNRFHQVNFRIVSLEISAYFKRISNKTFE